MSVGADVVVGVGRPEEYKELIDAVFRFDWRANDKIVQSFSGLLSHLVSANSTCMVPAMHMLVRNLVLTLRDLDGETTGDDRRAARGLWNGFPGWRRVLLREELTSGRFSSGMLDMIFFYWARVVSAAAPIIFVHRPSTSASQCRLTRSHVSTVGHPSSALRNRYHFLRVCCTASFVLDSTPKHVSACHLTSSLIPRGPFLPQAKATSTPRL